jgi:F-type H+-transporting ATPase subunit b
VIQLNITLIIQLINFLVFLYLLNVLLYKPIMAKMRERADRIAKDRDQARQLQQDVENQENRHQEKLAAVRETASQEKASLMAEAKKREIEILDKARVAADKIVDDMRSAIKRESEQVRKTLKDEMTPLARSITEKILGRSIA